MEYQVLREEPANSGTYIATGEKLDPRVDMVEACAALTASDGGRFAILPYDPLTRVAPARSSEEQVAEIEAREKADREAADAAAKAEKEAAADGGKAGAKKART